jgi:hypothetical protein
LFGPVFFVCCLAFLSEQEWAFVRPLFQRWIGKRETSEHRGPHVSMRQAVATVSGAKER